MELHVLDAGKVTVVLLDNDMKIVKPVYDFLKFQQQKSKADTLELIRAVSESVSGFQLVCAVVHVDQEDCYLHLHILYFEKDANKT